MSFHAAGVLVGELRLSGTPLVRLIEAARSWRRPSSLLFSSFAFETAFALPKKNGWVDFGSVLLLCRFNKSSDTLAAWIEPRTSLIVLPIRNRSSDWFLP